MLEQCPKCGDYIGESNDPMLPWLIEDHMRLLHPDMPRVSPDQLHNPLDVL